MGHQMRKGLVMVSKRDEAKTIASFDHIKCKWDGEWQQFRVTLDGLDKAKEEKVAYYTSDYDDAYYTAKAMSEKRANELAKRN